ncbi:MAG: Flp pilus assembly complex ATPase component TadA [Candidatus Omnitrophica bacterium]|nr:Flp pilus assembly complex ATPase component TadA [Candidatus Omnitrophota bacterium]
MNSLWKRGTMGMTLEDKICDHMVKGGKLSALDLKEAREIFFESGENVTDILIKLHKISRETFLSSVSMLTGITPLDLSRINIDRDLVSILPKRVALMYMVLPVARLGDVLTVAITDPTNIFAMDDLKAITKLNLRAVLSDKDVMREAITRFYERSADEEIEKIVDDIGASEMQMLGEEEEATSGDLLSAAEDTPIIKLANLILGRGVKQGASDILIEPMERTFRVRYRIDGILHEIETPPKKYHASLISRLKVMSMLNIAERRLPQDGRFQIKVEGRKVDFRLSILPSITGEKACLRILDKDQVMVDINRLGLQDRDRESIIEESEKPHGMILACGPTGSGKTTTLYSILKYVDSPGRNLVTVEDPVEYELSGINQVNVKSEIGLTFSSCLRSILRQDPDIILIGEIRDFETVDIAIKSALTGHLVLSTLHTNSASGSIVRLVNMGVEPFLIASSVIMIIAQRLVRKLCRECREYFVPEEKTARKFGLIGPDGKIKGIYRPKGCPVCMNSGYKGRAVIVECLRMTPAIKEILFRGADEPELEKKAREEGMITLRMNGMENVILGVTSLEEILRVTMDDRSMDNSNG